MSPAEAQVLLSMASAYDNRKPDADAAKAWAAALDDLRFEDCRVALLAHYRSSDNWLMPAMVRAAVKRIRAKRITEHPPLKPPAHLADDWAATNRWLAEARRRIGDGEVIDCDALYGELKQRDMSELRSLPAPPRDDENTTTEPPTGGSCVSEGEAS